ncbi:hypothetical protein EJB05_43928, partial [Eragrostis curvula]
MSGFVLRRFPELVGQGVRTDKGFKEVHRNQVARQLNESGFSAQEVSGNQVYNHMHKWCSMWVRICKLKDLSGALWDEENYMISLDESHYLGHTKDHPKDAEYLNPEIFGEGEEIAAATGKSQPINLEAESSKTATSKLGDDPKDATDKGKGVVNNLKRKRTCEEEYSVMIGMTEAVTKVATALERPQHNEVYDELYDSVMNTPGFTEEALMFALCYLLKNKAEGLCFVQMKEAHRVLWLRMNLGKNYFM